MKKRINTIDGKILVQGGTDNELKSNEIRVNADKSLTERINGEIVNVGSSSGGGLRPVTAEDFSSITLSNSNIGTMHVKFSDTITLPEQTTINIKLNNKKADLVQPVKEYCPLSYNEDQDVYGYHNKNYSSITFNISQLYIKEN